MLWVWQACLAAAEWTQALGIVVMPCCNFYAKLSIPGEEPLAAYDDPGVVSPHRLVRVYRRLR